MEEVKFGFGFHDKVLDNPLSPGSDGGGEISCILASLKGMPMKVSVSLGLLISELSEDSWKGKVITFSTDSQLHKINGNSLQLQTKFIRGME